MTRTCIDIFENPFSKFIRGFIVFAVRTYINLNFCIFHGNKVTFQHVAGVCIYFEF